MWRARDSARQRDGSPPSSSSLLLLAHLRLLEHTPRSRSRLRRGQNRTPRSQSRMRRGRSARVRRGMQDHAAPDEPTTSGGRAAAERPSPPPPPPPPAAWLVLAAAPLRAGTSSRSASYISSSSSSNSDSGVTNRDRVRCANREGCGLRPVGKLLVVPAGALPVPVRKGYIGLFRAKIAKFPPARAGLSSASQNPQHNCFPSALRETR